MPSLAWLVTCPVLSADDGDPWAVHAVDVASKRLEVARCSLMLE